MKTDEEIRKKICSIFDENSSDANNGQMSVITEDSYSDTIDEVVELFEAYYKEKQIELPSDEEICKQASLYSQAFESGYRYIADTDFTNGAKWAVKWIKDKMK